MCVCVCAKLGSFASHSGLYCTQLRQQQKMSRLFFPAVIDRSSKELLLQPVLISRNDKEKVLIEGSINSVRVSIAVKQVREQLIELIHFKKHVIEY